MAVRGRCFWIRKIGFVTTLEIGSITHGAPWLLKGYWDEYVVLLSHISQLEAMGLPRSVFTFFAHLPRRQRAYHH